MTSMTDEERRIRSYLQAQAAKLEPPALVERVRAGMEELRKAAAAIPPRRFDERPTADEWSASEVMAHVVEAGARVGDSIARILDGGSPAAAGPSRPGAAPPGRTAEDWWAILEQDRSILFERVLRADPRAQLDRTVEHGPLGPLNWRELLLFLRPHDLDHAGQLQQIAAALGNSATEPR